MLSKLHIGNFRSFKSLDIDRLGKINLVSGQNNSGKTSLLEAVFLLSGVANPNLLLNAVVIRGVRVTSGSEHVVQSTLWKPIFHDLDMNEAVEVTGHHFSHGEIKVRLTLEQPNLFEMPLDDGKVSLGDTPQKKQAFVLNYVLNNKPEADYNITLTGTTIKAERKQPGPDAEIQIPFAATILSHRNRNSENDAQLLGQLRQQKKGDLVVDALRAIEPRLQSLEVNTTTGAAMIWGDVGLSELVPLPVMGDGMLQLARVVLAISSTPSGIVLIDEVENGLHHSVLADIWRVVKEAAEQFKTQIIATTHSYECIAAAEKVLESSDDGEFLLHRLETNNTGSRCVTYDRETMGAAIQHNMEVR